ncbi:HAD family phosphatase [Clostridium sp. AL.422]|uniref:HAD family hydrolase n=1 Tax=Clostridium TaxID=1485 RepID=UPI00293DBB41|nr:MULTISPECIES: HAD family phosphatase [unclassified Clostridium]MDV4149892.1 HAD family phosphatase [Clostridium sp. AL.422]
MKENSAVKCIIFDMDGCLIDTESVYIKCWKKAFIKEGIPIEDAIVNSWAGKGISLIIAEINDLTKDYERTIKIRQMREDLFFEFLNAGEVELKPFTREILDFIKDRNLKLGLASSTFRIKATKVLKSFKLIDYFDFMVFGDDVKNVKPAPDIYNEAIKRSNENISDIIVFEDSISGVNAAKASGIERIIHIPDSAVENSDIDLDTFAKIKDFSQGIEIIKKYLR